MLSNTIMLGDDARILNWHFPARVRDEPGAKMFVFSAEWGLFERLICHAANWYRVPAFRPALSCP